MIEASGNRDETARLIAGCFQLDPDRVRRAIEYIPATLFHGLSIGEFERLKPGLLELSRNGMSFRRTKSDSTRMGTAVTLPTRMRDGVAPTGEGGQEGEGDSPDQPRGGGNRVGSPPSGSTSPPSGSGADDTRRAPRPSSQPPPNSPTTAPTRRRIEGIMSEREETTVLPRSARPPSRDPGETRPAFRPPVPSRRSAQTPPETPAEPPPVLKPSVPADKSSPSKSRAPAPPAGGVPVLRPTSPATPPATPPAGAGSVPVLKPTSPATPPASGAGSVPVLKPTSPSPATPPASGAGSVPVLKPTQASSAPPAPGIPVLKPASSAAPAPGSVPVLSPVDAGAGAGATAPRAVPVLVPVDGAGSDKKTPAVQGGRQSSEASGAIPQAIPVLRPAAEQTVTPPAPATPEAFRVMVSELFLVEEVTGSAGVGGFRLRVPPLPEPDRERAAAVARAIDDVRGEAIEDLLAGLPSDLLLAVSLTAAAKALRDIVAEGVPATVSRLQAHAPPPEVLEKRR